MVKQNKTEETVSLSRILVIDDDPQNLALLELLLSQEGHTVYTCDNAIDALAALEANPVDVVVTDIKMPCMSGLQLLEAVCEQHPDIPVILTTGYEEEGVLVDYLQKKAFDLLMKPHTRYQLFRAVNFALQHKRQIEKEKAQRQLLESVIEKKNQELHNVTLRLQREIFERSSIEEELKSYRSRKDESLKQSTRQKRKKSG